MEDIAPKLFEKIKSDFEDGFQKSKKIRNLAEKLKSGKTTYRDGHAFAVRVGEILSEVFQNNLSSDVLPDGRLYYNIADRIIRPMLEDDFEIIAEYAAAIQDILNKQAGIGIKALVPEMNKDRAQGIIDIVSGKEKFDDVAYMLGEPVINFSQAIVDDTVRANADFQYKSGLSPKIVRKSTGKCCEWCDKLAGTYEYSQVSDTGNDVFRRHKHCRCLVEYDAGDGIKQNVHTKQWKNTNRDDTIKETPQEKEKRIQKENGLDFLSKLSEHPKILSAYTPNSLYNLLRNSGYEIKPLKGKNYKDILFEDGGGFKVNFGGDGILMYHPGERSHHGGEYYKISTGKEGTKRYDREGNEIEKDR